MTFFKFLFLGLMFFGLLFPCFEVFAQTYKIQGIIILKRYDIEHDDGVKKRNYNLRIKQTACRDDNDLPLFLTAVALVEDDSFDSEIIESAYKKRIPCQFLVSKRGMRFIIHEIYLLEGARIDQGAVPEKTGITLDGNAVYYDKNNGVIINSTQKIQKSKKIGNVGIQIGGQ